MTIPPRRDLIKYTNQVHKEPGKKFRESLKSVAETLNCYHYWVKMILQWKALVLKQAAQKQRQVWSKAMMNVFHSL